MNDFTPEPCPAVNRTRRSSAKNPRGRRPATVDGAPDSPRGWLSGIAGVERILYRLPELLAADPEAPVFVVEGEKDVDNLHERGLVATCNAMGAGKWRDEYSPALAGRDVLVLPDNDE